MPDKKYKISFDKVLKYGCIAIMLAMSIYFVPEIIGLAISRHRINKNPAKTEACVQFIGKEVNRGPRIRVIPVTFTYSVADTIYQCWVELSKKEVAQLYIGKVVGFTYENGNPTNAMFEKALAHGETPIGHVVRVSHTEIDTLAENTILNKTLIKDSIILFNAEH